MIANNTLLVPRIESRIQVIRRLRVMLDVDLAALYGVQTKRLNEQVKRNRDRFPSDFLFQLTADEKTEVVANCDHLQNLKFSKALLFAPSPAANRWSFCKCTKTASPWPSTGPNYRPKRSWSRSCMRLCWRRVSGWRGAGCCWGTWVMSDDIRSAMAWSFPSLRCLRWGTCPPRAKTSKRPRGCPMWRRRGLRRGWLSGLGRCEIRGKVMKSADSDVIFKALISACHQATANSLGASSLLGRCKRT